jgi:hypothetical protein
MARKHFLRRPINLAIGGTIHHYDAGLHVNVPEDHASHPYFKKMDNRAALAAAPVAPKPAGRSVGVTLESGAFAAIGSKAG